MNKAAAMLQGQSNYSMTERRNLRISPKNPKKQNSLYLKESSSHEREGKGADKEVSYGNVEDEHAVSKPPPSS